MVIHISLDVFRHTKINFLLIIFLPTSSYVAASILDKDIICNLNLVKVSECGRSFSFLPKPPSKNDWLIETSN